jgi:hypothetical protein
VIWNLLRYFLFRAGLRALDRIAQNRWAIGCLEQVLFPANFSKQHEMFAHDLNQRQANKLLLIILLV